MKRCVYGNPTGRRCWAAAPSESQYCAIHAPDNEEHSARQALIDPTERYNAVGSFLDNYWAGDRLYVESFLEAAELAMGLAESLGASRWKH